MSKEVTLQDIHECLIGNKLAGQKGIIDTLDDLVENHSELKVCQEKTNDKVCVMQNHLHLLMQDREANIKRKSEQPKLLKWLKAAGSIFITAKTGM